ncbi:MAG TPA: MoaD/ThiS family protein [Longimicrobiales bacterium]
MVLQELTSLSRDAADGRAEIRLPTALIDHCGGQAVLFLPARTIGDALDGLVAAHPALRRHLFADTGGLRGYVNVFLNEDELRTLPAGLSERVQEGDVIMVVPSIAGG